MGEGKKKSSLTKHLVAGGAAGLVESSICHPLDTIKTRLQLSKGAKGLGVFGTGAKIVQTEGFAALYKGLTAVVSGITPKMAIRFSSFEAYKQVLSKPDGTVDNTRTFFAGMMAGVTEAVLVVTPMETCKVRLQAQTHSMSDPNQYNKRVYKNVLHVGAVMIRDEGVTSLYKGLVPTVLRQASNQAVNFTMYQIFKRNWLDFSNKRFNADRKELTPLEHFLIGGTSGGLGPLANCPMDVVKTRLQRQVVKPGEAPKYQGAIHATRVIVAEEGVRALWKGITPRLMRIMPGQAITFMVYERVSKLLFEPKPEVGLPSIGGAKEEKQTA